MARFGVELFVVAQAAVLSLGFILTYILAVVYNHVTPDFPYMSDTGGKAPESCVFTLVCNVSAFLGLGAIYIRYRSVHQYYRRDSKLIYVNHFTFAVGLFIVLGLMIVGAFQDDVVPTAHYVGAMMAFGMGIFYMWLQTFITFIVHRATNQHNSSSLMVCVRLILSLLATIFFVTTVVSGSTVKNPNGDDGIWPPSDTGFAIHVLSTSAEWALGICLVVFMLAFHNDFLLITVETTIKPRYTLQGRSWIDESSHLIT